MVSSKFIAIEELREVIKFLELNEIEKCELVSGIWNKSIVTTSQKPRRRIYQIEYNSTQVRFHFINNLILRMCLQFKY